MRSADGRRVVEFSATCRWLRITMLRHSSAIVVCGFLLTGIGGEEQGMDFLGKLLGRKNAEAAPAKGAPKAPAPKAAAPKAAAPKAAPAKSAPAAAGGSKGVSKHAAVCGDGISIANFEKMSYEQWKNQKGNETKTIQQWRDAVVQSLRDASTKDKLYGGSNPTATQDQANRFHEVADLLDGKKGEPAYTSTQQLENLMTGKVKGFTEYGKLTANGKWNDDYYGSHRKPMWRYLKEKGLADQGFWQHETSASWINKAGTKFYADPTEIPYLVSNVAPVGTFVKISLPKGPWGEARSTYARVLEGGTEMAEVSIKAWENMGFENITTAHTPGGVEDLNIEVFEGTGGLGKKVRDGAFSYENTHFTNDEIQRAGAIMDAQRQAGKPVTPIVTRDDLLKAEGKTAPPKQASADPAVDAGAGGNKLLYGFSTVATGSNTRLVGYACEDCLHDGGGYVLEGSSTVYVGKYPFARIADVTSDALAVVTGDETVFVGGTPTSATLA